jgi:tight adherence protein C
MLSRSGLLPASTLAELEQTLLSAGLRRPNSLSLFIGAKLLLLLLLPLAAFVVLRQTHLATAVQALGIGFAGVIGLLAPDTLLRRMRQNHLRGVELGLPDALDMLIICSEAGLGLEPGLERVAAEIMAAHPAVAMELHLTSTELRILSDRRVALTNMGARTGLSVMKRLGGTLIQTMQYGTPLSQALRTLSSEMRYEMQMRFEAQAARLPVLLTVPMIIFILPCIFIVVGGPAGLTVARTLLHH